MAAFRNISVVITANASQLVAAYAQASAATDAFAAAQAAASADLVALQTATTSQSRRLTTLAANSLNAAAGLELLGEASAVAGASAAMAGYQAAAAEINAMAVAAGRATAELTTLASASVAAGAAAGAGGAEQAAGAAAAAAGTSRMAAQAAQAERLVGQLAGSAGIAGAQLGTLGASATTAGVAARGAGTGMMFAGQAAAATLAVGLIAAVAGAVQFEAAMHNVASIDGQVRANFAATEAQILSLSRSLPQSAQTLVEGLYNIASSGFYGADAMTILGVSAKAASAGLTNTNTASKAIVASLNAYGLGASSATRVSDALFSTVNYGVISFEALTAAVANTVGNAARAGVGIEQVGAAMATMTLSGLSASNAGVGLNNLLAKMVKPSEALQQEFSKLGITQADLSDTGIGLYGVMMKLRDSGDANVKTLLQWFPEIRAARAAMALLAGDGATYTRVFGEMGNATLTAGATQAVFNEQMKSTKAQLSILKNEIVATGIEVGTALLPYLNDGIGGLERFGGVLRDLGGQLASGVAPGFRDLGDALGDLVAIARDLDLDDLALGFAKLGIGAVVVSFNTLAAIISALTGFLRDHEAVVIALGVAYAALKAEAVAAAIGTLAARFVELAAAMRFQGLMQLYNVFIQLNAVMAASAGAAAAMRTEFALAQALGFGPLTSGAYAARAGISALSGTVLASIATVGLYAAAFAAAVISIKSIVDAGHEGAQAAKEFEASMNPGSIRAYGDEMETLRSKAHGFLDLNWGLLGGIPTMLLENANANRGLADELDRVGAKQQAFLATADQLATQYGVTRAQVLALADAHRIDLSGGLNAVDASGKSVAATFAGLLAPLALAGVSADQMGVAMKALETVTGGADEELKSLNLNLDIFIGKGLAAAEASDAFQKTINNLSTNLAEGSRQLTGNSDAAIQNRAAIFGAIEAAMQHSKALVDSGVSATDAKAAFDQHTAAIVAAAVAAGFDKDQVVALINSLSLIPPDVKSQVTTPGVLQSTTDVKALLTQIGLLPDQTNSNIATPGATQGKSEVDALREAIGMLHDKTITVTTIQYEIIQRAYDNAQNPTAASATRRAYGGPIYGPGGPTDDRVHVMASPGEWVIRASSAQSYGYAAMAAVNAGTATINGYATGGPVSSGPVFPPRFAAGGLVPAGGWGGSTSISFAPVIQINGAANPQATAAAVEQMIDRKFGAVVHAIKAGKGRGRG